MKFNFLIMDTRAESNFSFFNPNYDKSVFYVERSFNKQVNEFIQQNFLEFFKMFREQGINFIYMPYLIDNQEYINILNYNHPNLEINNQKEFIANLNTEIFQKYNLEGLNCGLLAISDSMQNEFDEFCNFNLNDLLSNQILRFLDKLKEKQENNDSEFCAMFSISPCKSHFIGDSDDLDLEYDEEIIEADILRNIEKLHEKGALKIISRIIDKINANSFKISRLLITDDYKLFLKDYNMKLITMTPLEKSIFILYLNHPEGIPFKCLIDFHDELLSIYRNLTNRADVDKAMESIRDLTNPLSNSINEKVSRIRAAFLTCLTQEIAKNYYIVGKKGCPKKITLDRNLIEYQ